jgi:hypothetical protein
MCPHKALRPLRETVIKRNRKKTLKGMSFMNRFVLAISCFFFVSGVSRALTAADTGDTEDYLQWSKSKQIILNTSASGFAIGTNLTGFPYLVRLGKKNFNFSEAQANGSDVRFANATGQHMVYEVEQWDSGSQKAAIWVRIDTIRGNNPNQYFTMYWGKDSAASRSKGGSVFDTLNGFMGVWHLNTAGTGKRPDATFFDDSALSKGSSNTTAGIIGGCDTFASVNKTYDMVTGGKNLANRSFTLMAWSRLAESAPAGNKIILSQGVGVADSGLHFGYIASIGKYSLRFFNDDVNQITPFTGGTKWHFITGSYNASDKKQALYIDGALDNFKAADKNYIGTGALGIGALVWKTMTGDYFDGTIDEVVIADTVRSPDWIKLCYLTQKMAPETLPTIKYPSRNIEIPVSSDSVAQMITPIVPVTTEIVDSFTVSSELPAYLLFDTKTGIISGLPSETCTDRVYYIRAYNALGFAQDTILLTVYQPTAVGQQKSGKNPQPRLLGIRHSGIWSILFSMPSTAVIRDVSFELYDCKGAIVWSSRLDGSGLHGGVQSLGIGCADRSAINSGVYFLKMSSTLTSGRRTLTGTIRLTMVR